MEHADGRRRLGVRANADTPEDAARARRFGAEGIGLCRTEHMFLGDRKTLVEDLIVAETTEEQEHGPVRAAAAAARRLPRHPRGDGRAAGDDPADRPAAARVPAGLHRAVGAGGGGGRARQPRQQDQKLLAAVKRLHEENPMLGLRGVRLGIVIPGLFAMQARAILEAAAALIRRGPGPPARRS